VGFIKNMLKSAVALLKTEAEAIERAAANLNSSGGDSFIAAVELIEQAIKDNKKLVFMGIGKSHYIAAKLTASFVSTGVNSVFIHPTEALHGDIGAVLPGDVCLFFSKSGRTAELNALIPFLKKNNNKIISFTGILDSKLALNSDVVIDASVEKEACPINMLPTASTTVALALGDALLAVVSERRKFSKVDFAILHPGGSIGRRLNTEVNQVMIDKSKVACGDKHTLVTDVAKQMSLHAQGAFCVLDNQKLIGIIVEGDLRRAMANNVAANDKAENIMTKDPVVLNQNQMLQECLEIFEAKKISGAPVVDSKAELIGFVRLQDLI